MSNNYEERVTMIAAGDLQEFVPFGRDHCKHHPNALNLQLRQLQPASELWSSDGAAGLVGSLQEVTIHEKQKESWLLRRGVSDVGEEVEYDEELYVAGNMVIWSKGSKSQASAVYKAFTVDSPVLQALWCDFTVPQEKSEKVDNSDEIVEKCICILQSSCINVHSIEGKDYIASLPFQVANVWPTKYGLLFERSSTSHEVPLSPPREPLPTMFSMLHPLDEITPLVCKSGGVFGSARVQYVADYTLRIVFLNEEPSIVMTYDTVQSLHAVWALRRVKPEEQNTVLKFSEQVGTPQHVATSSSLTAHLRSLSKGDSPMASPFQNYSSLHSQSRSLSSPSVHSRSPSISNMAALREDFMQILQAFGGGQLPLRKYDLKSIDTLLVLEGNGNLVLYTGVVRGVLLSPVPELRDSSKLHDSSYIDDCTFQQLGTFIHSVRDPVHNRVTLELSNSSMVRITIPEIATSELVKRCLQGIKSILPKEIAVQMLVKWYNAYNAPGGPSYHSEWSLFVTCLMNLMGYNTDRLAWMRNLDLEGSLSPVIAPKKARPSETGSDESVALYILGDESAVSNEASHYLFRITSGQRKQQTEQDDNRYSFRHSTSVSNLAEKMVIWMTSVGAEAEEDDDGMNDMNQEVMSLIWSEDLRVQEVRRLLQSAHPVRVSVVQMPEVSDHEYIEEKENRLLQLCQRTMALPLGRGMFTLFSYHPVPTEPLPIPKLNLTGRAPPRNTTVDLNSGNIDVPPNMACWASFHNGVAAGLKIAPASQIDSAWIVYNKPKNAELANEYAGFLMALGLNGHLTKLATLNIHDYLTKGHEMTSIGLLLGVSAAKLGTMDMAITRLLSIHIPALLPPTSTELDVPHNVQVAAVIGIGLVYQGTAHRHTAEVLLAEIGRPPGPEMEYCTDRESYSLAAGLALGMVCLGHGSNLIGMSDLNVPEQLYQYMVGGHKRFQAGIKKKGMHREKHKSPSYQIKTLARCLILWDDILPNSKWVDSNVPQIIRENRISLHATELPSSEDLNLETLAQAHVYIIAGACLSLGFRFAGSENLAAFNCLFKFAKDFMKCLSAPTASICCLIFLTLGNRPNSHEENSLFFVGWVEECKLMGRVKCEADVPPYTDVLVAIIVYSLSTSDSSIAALLCALYPHFPVHSSDNRYHLQALRHLYVLAAEPRLLVPVDVDTNIPCYTLLEVTYKIRVKGPRYWELLIDLSKGTHQLKSILSKDGILYVKLRAGQLSYKEDPMGWRSLLAQAVTHRNSETRTFKPETISAFTSDPALLSFADYFCKPAVNMGQKQEILDLFSSILYECVTRENPEMLPAYIAIDQAVRILERKEMSETFELWQIKLVLEFFSSRSHQERVRRNPNRGLFMNSEFLPVMKCTIDNTLDQWLQAGGDVSLHSYLSGQPTEESQLSMLACFLVYHSVPTPGQLSAGGLEVNEEKLQAERCRCCGKSNGPEPMRPEPSQWICCRLVMQDWILSEGSDKKTHPTRNESQGLGRSQHLICPIQRRPFPGSGTALKQRSCSDSPRSPSPHQSRECMLLVDRDCTDLRLQGGKRCIKGLSAAETNILCSPKEFSKVPAALWVQSSIAGFGHRGSPFTPTPRGRWGEPLAPYWVWTSGVSLHRHLEDDGGSPSLPAGLGVEVLCSPGQQEQTAQPMRPVKGVVSTLASETSQREQPKGGATERAFTWTQGPPPSIGLVLGSCGCCFQPGYSSGCPGPRLSVRCGTAALSSPPLVSGYSINPVAMAMEAAGPPRSLERLALVCHTPELLQTGPGRNSSFPYGSTVLKYPLAVGVVHRAGNQETVYPRLTYSTDAC
ncbi:Anaphase-promoting complex subunit 1 [Chelonia mydas]|uniref:Anaphase-promoting complex subunit 1 n=1 Tax=Chelonia mydas TaxID=8469 RepID=M7C7L0_CHEMY|nr:Anaphase-promoting complex subunit 1 [Chelonia mydas]